MNINRLLNKLDGIRDLLSDYNLDILALNETWLTRDISDDEINISGYSVARKDRSNPLKSSGGGVIFYVRENIPFIVRPDLTTNTSEHLWIEITRQKCKPLLVASVYRPPNLDVDELIHSLNESFSAIMERFLTMILGDFNVDQLSRNNSNKTLLASFAIENNLKQIISEPTRITQTSRTLIDLIYVNDSPRIVQSGVVHSTLSDHSLTFCIMKCSVPKLPPRKFEYRSFKNYNTESFVKELSQVPWSVIDGVDYIDDAVLLWDQLFSSVADIHAPLKFKRAKGIKNPWVTTKLLEIRRDRDYHHKKAQVQISEYHWKMYEKLRNYSNYEERNLKSKYFCKLVEEAKNDGGEMWKAIKNALPNPKKSAVFSIFDNGKVYTDSASIAKIMNNHFISIGKKLSKAFKHCTSKFSTVNSQQLHFNLVPVDEGFVSQTIAKLRPSRAVGLDKLSARLLRDGCPVIAPVLTSLINKSLSDGAFPKLWKSAKVSALFKGGDKLSKDNYRPISILPTVSKIIERAVHLQLSNYLEHNNLLSTCQFGFRLGKSTSTALVNFTGHILSNMDSGKVTGAVFLDLKKAFDTVNHEFLIKKLKNLGVIGKSLSWFNSYLSGRTQKTVCGNTISPKAKVSIGVPQGSILGPLFFLIYINGIESTLKSSKMTMFADDMAFYCSETSAADLQGKLNYDLQSISSWLQEHKLTLNINKSEFMIIGSRVKLKNFQDVQLVLEQDSLENVTEFKYLGIIINQHLTWHDHVEMLHSKVAQRLGVLKRVRHLLPVYARKLYVMTMIVPLLDYASVVWSDKNNKTLMNSLQILHNKAA